MYTMDSNLKKTKDMVITALLFAMALVLSFIENSLPPILVQVPGVKIGLSNIAVMYALFFLGKRQACSIAVLKAFFVFLTRGFVGSALAFSGGILSIIIMSLLMLIFREKITYLILSIFGAVFHNIGQFIAISFIYSNMFLWVYLPVLLIAGVLAGIATSVLLRFILPALKRLT